MRRMLFLFFILCSLRMEIDAVDVLRTDVYYSIRTPDRKLCLEIYGRSLMEGNGTWFNDCQVFTPKSSMFLLKPADGGEEYVLISALSELVLTANGPGMNLTQKKSSPILSQVVVLERTDSGRMKLKFKKSGLYVSGWGGDTKQGSLPAEGNEQTNGSDEFVIKEELKSSEIDAYRTAKKMVEQAKELTQKKKLEK